MDFSSISVASSYYDYPNLFLNVLIPVSGCHFLMAQFVPWLNTMQQRKGPFACVAFSFGLNTVLYRVSLYVQGKETPR